MTAFIFFISFLLHIISFIAIGQLLKQLKQLKQIRHENNTKDILDLFETYLQEIKEENRILDEKLTKKRVQQEIEPKLAPNQTLVEPTNNLVDNSDYGINEMKGIEADDTFEASLQAKVLQLHSQGMSYEEIAKKLNCGKTETELIIKLHSKNE